MSDSMARSIRNNDLNSSLTNSAAMIKKFPGQTAVEIAMYTECQIQLNKPDQIMVIAGTNDISFAHQADTFCAEEIAEKIIEVGKVGSKHGVPIIVSGLFVRRKYNAMNRCIKAVNEILLQRCQEEGFEFMSQDNIKERDIYRGDGLHLGKEGSAKLMKNSKLSLAS